MFSWLMFVACGIGPYSGQCMHFRHAAPEPKEYALNRDDFEAWRHWGMLNDRLADRRHMLGDGCTIVDMAVWGWARMVPHVPGGPEAWDRLSQVKRLLDQSNARPAAQRAAARRMRPAFKAAVDDETRRVLFPQNERLRASGN